MMENVVDYLHLTGRLAQKRIELGRLGFLVTDALESMADFESLRNGPVYYIEIEIPQKGNLSGELQVYENLGEGKIEIPLEYNQQDEAQEDGFTSLMVQNNRTVLGITAPLTESSEQQIFVALGMPFRTSIGDFYVTTGGDNQVFNLVIDRDKINRTHLHHVSSDVRMRKDWPLSENDFSALSAAVFMKEFNQDMTGKLKAYLPLSQE